LVILFGVIMLLLFCTTDPQGDRVEDTKSEKEKEMENLSRLNRVKSMREFEMTGIEDKMKRIQREKETEINSLKRFHKEEMRNLEKQITESQYYKDMMEKWKKEAEDQAKKVKMWEEEVKGLGKTQKEDQEKELQNIRATHTKEVRKWEKAAEVNLEPFPSSFPYFLSFLQLLNTF
jgi:hypothetical protein